MAGQHSRAAERARAGHAPGRAGRDRPGTPSARGACAARRRGGVRAGSRAGRRAAPVAGRGRSGACAARAGGDARQPRRYLARARHQSADPEPDDSAVEPASAVRLSRSHSGRGGPDWRANGGARAAVFDIISIASAITGVRRWHIACPSGMRSRGSIPDTATYSQEVLPMRTFSLAAALTALTLSASALAAQSTSPQPATKPAMNQSSAVHVKQDSTKKAATASASAKSSTTTRHAAWTKDDIKQAQEGLTNADTRKALREYQKQNKLPVTGRLSDSVLVKLKSA